MNKFSEITIIILAWLALASGVILIGIGVYLIPIIFMGMQFSLPGFLQGFSEHIVYMQEIKDASQKVVLLAPLFLAGVALLILSRYASFLLNKDRREDKNEETYTIETPEIKPDEEQAPLTINLLPRQFSFLNPPERIHPLIKVLFYMVLIFVVLTLLELLLAVEWKLF